jgi:Ser/Thr protein kinase RdoA (MazF antagonist)
MNDPRQALLHWFDDAHNASIDPNIRAGFSGAQVWKVEHQGASWALRQWPERITAERAAGVHDFQRDVARLGFPVPALRRSPLGNTLAQIEGRLWEIATWLPGAADYWERPTPAKLKAALAILARLHLATEPFIPKNLAWWPKPLDPSPALRRRASRLEQLLTEELRAIERAIGRAKASPRLELAREAIALAERAASPLADEAPRWWDEPLPLGWCLRDVWHDHILFTGESVTGLLDLAAFGFDAYAGDVARLLGSMVQDDRPDWGAGLEAYGDVRPLAAAEIEAARFFDASGTVISAVNWIHWLFRVPSPLPATVDKVAGFERFKRLVGRLRVLAESR